MGGMSLSFDGESEDTKSRTTFGGGIIADYMLNDNIAVSVQPMMMSKGAKQDETEQFFGSEFKISYIEVPVLFRYLIGSGGIRPFFEVGPSIGFRGSAEIEFSDGDTQDIDDDLSSTDVSVVFGIGAEVPVASNQAFALVRYAAGLSDIANEDEVEARTNGIQILLGFKLPIGGN